MRNADHMKKFVDPGTETAATEAELPTPSVITDTPKEGVISGQNPVGGIQQNSQTHSAPPPLSPIEEGPKSRPVRKRETPKWMKDFANSEWTLTTVCHVLVVYTWFNRSKYWNSSDKFI